MKPGDHVLPANGGDGKRIIPYMCSRPGFLSQFSEFRGEITTGIVLDVCTITEPEFTWARVAFPHCVGWIHRSELEVIS